MAIEPAQDPEVFSRPARLRGLIGREKIRTCFADLIKCGRADWRIDGVLDDGRHFEVVYDHPHGTDQSAVWIVSVWPL